MAAHATMPIRWMRHAGRPCSFSTPAGRWVQNPAYWSTRERAAWVSRVIDATNQSPSVHARLASSWNSSMWNAMTRKNARYSISTERHSMKVLPSTVSCHQAWASSGVQAARSCGRGCRGTSSARCCLSLCTPWGASLGIGVGPPGRPMASSPVSGSLSDVTSPSRSTVTASFSNVLCTTSLRAKHSLKSSYPILEAISTPWPPCLSTANARHRNRGVTILSRKLPQSPNTIISRRSSRSPSRSCPGSRNSPLRMCFLASSNISFRPVGYSAPESTMPHFWRMSMIWLL
mmetsp:Transcript_3840/g.11096  ORF Transcript_3840/g.11096 Transcript_3840/m.11096 type:complete len:289 (+) Transcript_3840:5542-6408(+)